MEKLMSELQLEVVSQASAVDLEWVRVRLSLHNNRCVGRDDFQWLFVFLRDSHGQRQAGLIAWTMWSWFHIDQLWVEPALRGQGHGRRLLQAAEQEAIARGCQVAEVDTFSFQAQGFYEKAGYTVFGRLEGIAEGVDRIYLQKRLPRPTA